MLNYKKMDSYKRTTISLFSILLLVLSCQDIPSKQLSQFSFKPSTTYTNNILEVKLTNPLHCPLRIFLKNSNKNIQQKFDLINPIIINGKKDSIIRFFDLQNFNDKINYRICLGDVNKSIKLHKLELPFSKNKTYKVIQGNNSKYSHNSDYSKYALDFNLKINDTICSATNGYVVGVIKDYKYGGKDKKWKPYGNFITIYEPNSGIFTQYVHLIYNGSLVVVGDKVKAGQAIGLSGKTGYTNTEHLHFNCLVPDAETNNLKSIPYQFLNGIKSENLRKNDILTNQ